MMSDFLRDIDGIVNIRFIDHSQFVWVPDRDFADCHHESGFNRGM